MSKLMVGIPAYKGIAEECQKSVLGMTFRLGRETDYDVAVEVIIKKEQFRARNTIVTSALAGGFDYLLMLDDDMLVPHNLVQALMSHEKDVVGALYYQRGGGFKPVVMDAHEDEYGGISHSFWLHTDPRIVDSPGLYPCDVIGGGCMLFKVSVFEKMLYPYFHPELDLGTDVYICKRLREAAIQPYIDTSIELGHVGEKKIVTSRTMPLDQRLVSEAAEMLGKDLEAYYHMPADWVNQQMEAATTKKARKDAWGDRTTEWDDVKAFYQENKDWHIFNLSGFNIWNYDPCKAWMLSEGARLLGPDKALIDYGPGVGFVSIPLSLKCTVHVVEVGGAGTLDFLECRDEMHKGSLWIDRLVTPYPEWTLGFKVDGACIISVLNHLTHPYETVAWIRDQLKPGAFFVCDWALHSDHKDGEEPQHLDRYDVTTWRSYLFSLGFVASPEYPWLFFYQPLEVAHV